MLTYKQAYDLLIDAYYKDEIKPYDASFCFCGNLNENNRSWLSHDDKCTTHYDGINYNGKELWLMEDALLSHLNKELYTDGKYTMFSKDYSFEDGWVVRKDTTKYENYEDVLFEAFCKALDVLKQIHIERGEVIDEVCELSKRVLVK